MSLSAYIFARILKNVITIKNRWKQSKIYKSFEIFMKNKNRKHKTFSALTIKVHWLKLWPTSKKSHLVHRRSSKVFVDQLPCNNQLCENVSHFFRDILESNAKSFLVFIQLFQFPGMILPIILDYAFISHHSCLVSITGRVH